MHINAYPDRCIGAGRCAVVAPDLFESGEDGLVILLRQSTDDPRLHDAALEAAELCPVMAISVGAPAGQGKTQ